MPRYIDAEKIPYNYTNERGVPMTREIDIQNVPTADVVEVVRCKDCRNSIPYNERWVLPKCDTMVWCKAFEDSKLPDWFCGYAKGDSERRT